MEFPTNSSFLKSKGLIYTSSWNRSQGETDDDFAPKKKVCRPRSKKKSSEDDLDLIVGSSVLAQLRARFNALDAKISTQSTLFSE